mgnify:CR=1 FL=1
MTHNGGSGMEEPQVDRVDEHDEPLSVAVTPLLGNEETEEAGWVGAALGKLLGEMLAAAGLEIAHHNAVAQWLVERRQALPVRYEAGRAGAWRI